MANNIDLSFLSLPDNLLSRISLQNQVVFGNEKFHVLKSMGCVNIGTTLAFSAAEIQPEIRERTIRKMNIELNIFNKKLNDFR